MGQPGNRVQLRLLKETLFLLIFLSFPFRSWGGEWVNPKDLIGDPQMARLQQGRKELTPLEKEEVDKYGYTGLEIQTYADVNKFPGQDWDAIFRAVKVSASGQVIGGEIWAMKTKFFYKDYCSLLTYEDIKPEDVRMAKYTYMFYPPDMKDNTYLALTYVDKEGTFKEEAIWEFSTRLRRVRRYSATPKQSNVSNWETTYDDYRRRHPWEDDHRILGLDHFKRKECFVIESKNRLDPDYYLSKRVSWIEKDNFLVLHEEQFNREGKIFVIMDKDWQQIEPWNYWAMTVWDMLTLSLKTRTFYESFDWRFDQGFSDREFTLTELEKNRRWREFKKVPSSEVKVSDLPPPPEVRWKFWNKMKIKPEVAK